MPHPTHPEVGLEGSPEHTHEAAGVADASQAGTDVIPDADAAPADPLPHCQLQEEQGQPDDDEQDQVWDQVGTWKGTEWSSQISLLQGSQGQMDKQGRAGTGSAWSIGLFANRLKLRQGSLRLDIWTNFFMERMVRHWHRLSRAAVESPSLQGFQNCVDVPLGDMG